MRVQLHFLKETEGRKELNLEKYLPNDFASREIISEVIKLIKLILLIPATNVLSERAASAVCCIKTYLTSTSTLSQKRLIHCMILHIHKDSLPLLEFANDFISNENRKLFWGKFAAKDLFVYNNKTFNGGDEY